MVRSLLTAYACAKAFAVTSDDHLMTRGGQLAWLNKYSNMHSIDRSGERFTGAVIGNLRGLYLLGDDHQAGLNAEHVHAHGTLVDVYANRLHAKYPATLFLPVEFWDMLGSALHTAISVDEQTAAHRKVFNKLREKDVCSASPRAVHGLIECRTRFTSQRLPALSSVYLLQPFIV